MSANIARRLRALEAAYGIHDDPACPECGTGQQVIVLMGDEPEPICGTCDRPVCRGEGAVVVQFTTREDGPL